MITALGALITIVMIALDPFAQQIVRYTPCSQASTTSKALILKTNFYENSGYHVGAGLDTVDLGFQAALTVGLFSPTSSALRFSCASGNCSFPQVYRSLGYCSTCKDISSEIKIAEVSATL